MKWLRNFSFGMVGLLVLCLVVATLLEKQYGTAFVLSRVYGSPFFVAAWAVAALLSVVYVCRRKLWKRPFVFLLHLSFVVILSGAFITHVWGIQGDVHLRQDAAAPVTAFTTAGDGQRTFPFALSLDDFRVEHYPGTSAPMDFVSRFRIEDEGRTVDGEVSMNRIFSYRNYRFYQSTYDSDGLGTTLSVSYDPWGIGVTYAGYALLLLSMSLFFFDRQSAFRRLLKHPLLRSAAVVALLLLPFGAGAAPRVLPQETAAAFGRLAMYYNDRVCPLQTLAKDFTVKLCGKSSYEGLTPEQVLTGWFFYYDDWKNEPCIRIKSTEVRRLLGVEGKYARLTDFIGAEGYKLDAEVQNSKDRKDRRALEEANEKFSLVSMAAAGSIWKLYPYVDAESGMMTWYSLADRLPYGMPDDMRVFVRGSMNYVAEQVAIKDFRTVETLVGKIGKYQRKEAGDVFPSDPRFKAELVYNRLNFNRPLAMACVLIGILAFLFYIRRLITNSPQKSWLQTALNVLLVLIFSYLSVVIALRGYVSGHWPLSNGFETMQFMAWCSVLLTLVLQRRFTMAVPFGFLLCGLTLMVSMMGEANPQITQLMPVLQSPLLSIHVVVIMIAYSLLAFVMLNGLTAVVLHKSGRDCGTQIERLQVISRIMLYPAVFLLAAGIFIGAVWANISWGRYWGWDPKEVWALITLLVYSAALHPASLGKFRNPMFFHVFCIIAFLTVLVTYFGVNFLLGGMHSYANA